MPDSRVSQSGTSRRIHWHERERSPDVIVAWRAGIHHQWERTYIAADVIEALLPKVYDGMHLADCPYVDVLLRIKAALDA